MKSITVCMSTLLVGALWLAYGAQPAKGPADVAVAQAVQADPGTAAEAERLYAEGSYQLAHALYVQLEAQALDETERRWVEMRVADTAWRSQAATDASDEGRIEAARQRLEALVQAATRIEDRDRVWAEAHESLGDLWWSRPQSRNWGQGQVHYQQALDWWAGDRDIERARERYLAMVWKMAEPRQADPYYYYGYYGNFLPVETLDNALEIAATAEDRARANYLLAMTLRQQGDLRQTRRIVKHFEAALAHGKAGDWYDDALYHYAEWTSRQGRVAKGPRGGLIREPDFATSLRLYRRLTTEFRKGETRYYDQAVQQIAEITGFQVSVDVSNVFLPGSEIQYHLGWRNLEAVELTLHAVDLARDVAFGQADSDGSGTWLRQVKLDASRRIAAWTHPTGDKGGHLPGRATLTLDAPLDLGAYVLEAHAAGVSARELILVTDATVVLKMSGRQALVYYCGALDGAPIGDARIALWEHIYNGRRWEWRAQSGMTGADGLTLFELTTGEGHASRDVFVGAVGGKRQAFATGDAYDPRAHREGWRIQAFTDRPAYRPAETVQWKVVARRHDGETYSTPSGRTLNYRVTDARGADVVDGELQLNAFGSAWGSVELGAGAALGEYNIQFADKTNGTHIGQATLFRVEEYKLPEFTVRLRTPEDEGRKRVFRLGDTVTVEIEAEYYFGGPVAEATVEVLVRQAPYYQHWSPPHKYPWLYEDMSGQRTGYWGGGGQIVDRATLTTDAQGRATLEFDTPADSGQEFEYTIEARVTDASRREIVATDSVRVTRQSYYVYPRPRHNIYQPQDKVTFDVRALDAGGQPVSATGTATLTRDHWYEIWLDPQGREVRGERLDRIRRDAKIFPPPPTHPGEPGWTLKFRGYEHEEILVASLHIGEDGSGEFSFTPEREGYYRLAWESDDGDSGTIQAEASVWVADDSTRALGYRTGGVEIIVDAETFRVGQEALVMLSAETGDRYVLFSVEAEDLKSYRLVHVTGNVKLIRVDIDERHVPNIFLSAVMVADGQMHMDTKQIVVPPDEQFIDVEVGYDRETYEPRETATLTIRTRDHRGQPVPAEVALGVVDDAIYAIQEDYAADPRQFFFGDKRGQHVTTRSTLQQLRYLQVVEYHDVTAMPPSPEELSQEKSERQEFADADGGRGRMAADMAVGQAANMAPPSLAKQSATPESLAVSAVQVRSDFRATAFWQPGLVTGDDGLARVDLQVPDSLTRWRATARVVDAGNRFGFEKAESRTSKALIVRLQAPRFFVVGDASTVSAVINNNTDVALTVTPALQAEGLVVRGALEAGVPRKGEPGPVTVPAGGEARVDWWVGVDRPGNATLTVTAEGGGRSDAMRREYLVHEHGIEKFVARSGKLRSDDVTVTLDVPREREPATTELIVQVTPSMAVTLLDALPYLIDYPYGCTEQTLSRFLPTAITRRTLTDLGLKPEDILGKVFGGIEPAHADRTHSRGAADMRRMDEMVRQGLARLYDFQHADGGWGWWKEGESDRFMTAYVVWGLTLAGSGGIDVKDDVVERAATYLRQEIVAEELQPDRQAWMLHALAQVHAATRDGKPPAEFEARALDNLWQGRDRLNAYTRALLALSAHHYGDTARAQTLVRNLQNGVKIDRSPDTSIVSRGATTANAAVIGTAHWGEDGVYYRWSEGGVEATAFALRALLLIDPRNELIEPVTNWLVKNRRGSQWSNTRDTAIVVLALNDYLRVSGELRADLSYEVLVNGTSIARQDVRPALVLAAPSRFVVDPALVRDGANDIRIVRTAGEGALYFSAEVRYFSREEPITAAGNEIFVRREYFKRVGRPTLLKGYVYENQLLGDGDSVTSGDRIEAVITIEAKNNYEYLVFEDLKPAGFEALAVKSGEPLFARQLRSGAAEAKLSATAARRPVSVPPIAETSDFTGRGLGVHQELRDRQIALFIDKLPEGLWEIRYELRAETPGEFHALPVIGHAMYVPEIRCNGEEVRVTVLER